MQKIWWILAASLKTNRIYATFLLQDNDNTFVFTAFAFRTGSLGTPGKCR